MNNRLPKGRKDELLEEIISTLDAVRDKPALELEERMREVELTLVDLREELIEAVHAPQAQPELRAHLEQVNTALSLIIALEYPVSGLERGKIDEAADLLRTLTRSVIPKEEANNQGASCSI